MHDSRIQIFSSVIALCLPVTEKNSIGTIILILTKKPILFRESARADPFMVYDYCDRNTFQYLEFECHCNFS